MLIIYFRLQKELRNTQSLLETETVNGNEKLRVISEKHSEEINEKENKLKEVSDQLLKIKTESEMKGVEEVKSLKDSIVKLETSNKEKLTQIKTLETQNEDLTKKMKKDLDTSKQENKILVSKNNDLTKIAENEKKLVADIKIFEEKTNTLMVKFSIHSHILGRKAGN